MNVRTLLFFALFFPSGIHAQFAAGVDIATGNDISKLHGVDFDGDDDMDVVLLDDDVIGWVANDGSGQFGAFTALFTFGMDGGSFAVSDLDGNGTPDLVVRDAETAQLSTTTQHEMHSYSHYPCLLLLRICLW